MEEERFLFLSLKHKVADMTNSGKKQKRRESESKREILKPKVLWSTVKRQEE